MMATALRPKVLYALMRSKENPPIALDSVSDSSIALFCAYASSFTPLPGRPPEMGKGK